MRLMLKDHQARRVARALGQGLLFSLGTALVGWLTGVALLQFDPSPAIGVEMGSTRQQLCSGWLGDPGYAGLRIQVAAYRRVVLARNPYWPVPGSSQGEHFELLPGTPRRADESAEEFDSRVKVSALALVDRHSYVLVVQRYAAGVAKAHPCAGTVPDWCIQLDGKIQGRRCMSITDGIGWPVAMLTGGMVYSIQSDVCDRPLLEMRGASLLHAEEEWSGHHVPRSPLPWDVYLIPFRPHWFGIVVDVGFWSALAGVIPWCVQSIRTHARRSVGKCPRCGYRLREGGVLKCPECGLDPWEM